MTKTKIVTIEYMCHNKGCLGSDIIGELIGYFKTLEPGQRIIIRLNSEGYALPESGLNEVIEFVADLYNIKYTDITICTSSLVKPITNFNVIRDDTVSVFALDFITSQVVNKNIDKRFCIFIRGFTIYRLVLSAWLYKNALRTTFLSFNTTKESCHADIRDLILLNPNMLDIASVFSFINRLPIHIDEINRREFYLKNRSMNWALLKDYYPRTFVEIVVETAMSGRVFYPTEKIFRPIAFETPFIVFGPRGFLHNLKKLGFKTFNKWWPEDYDFQVGMARFDMIINILDMINKQPISTLMQWNNEMQDILHHNRQLLISMNWFRVSSRVWNNQCH